MDSKLPKEYVDKLLKQLEKLKMKKANKQRKLQTLRDAGPFKSSTSDALSVQPEVKNKSTAECAMTLHDAGPFKASTPDTLFVQPEVKNKSTAEHAMTLPDAGPFKDSTSDALFVQPEVKNKSTAERALRSRRLSLKYARIQTEKNSSDTADKKVPRCENEMLHLSLQKNAFGNGFLKKESSNSCTDSKYAKFNCTHDEKVSVHENCNSLISGNNKLEKDVENCSEIKGHTCYNIHALNKDSVKNVTHSCFQKYNSLKNDSLKIIDNVSPVKHDFNAKMDNEIILSKNHETTLVNDKLSFKVKKSHLVEKPKTENIAVLHKKGTGNPDYAVKEACNNETLLTNVNLLSDHISDVIDDCIENNLEESLVSKISSSAKNITCSTKTSIISNCASESTHPSNDKLKSPVNFALKKRLSSGLDAHYKNPMKLTSKIENSEITSDGEDIFVKVITGKNRIKKRKLFSKCSSNVCMQPKLKQHQKSVSTNSKKKSVNVLCKTFSGISEPNQEMIFNDFSNENVSNSKPNSLKNVSDHQVTLEKISCDDKLFKVNNTVNDLDVKVCENTSTSKPPNTIVKTFNKKENFDDKINENIETDSEILIIPETQDLSLYFANNTEHFLDTCTLSEGLEAFPVKDNVSKFKSLAADNIIATVKSSKASQNIQIDNEDHKKSEYFLSHIPKKARVNGKCASDVTLTLDDSMGLDTSFLEDNTQNLGNFKQIPYMNQENNIHGKVAADETETGSNLNFICTLFGTVNQAVVDAEIILFNNVKYAVIQQKTYIIVWCQERKKQWIKIFSHEIEDMFSLVKTCVTMDDDNLVIVMLLSNYKQYCLQFLIFEKDARVIKLMENTHWLEQRYYSEDSILLCGLSGLMFAISQNKTSSEVSIHTFIGMKESPKLLSAVLGCTEAPLCSLCKIDKFPNELMGVSDSMLYVWHISETRLITALRLHPHDYIPIKECFWATVENGVVYFLTTCEGEVGDKVCQLLAANLATGLCQSAMTYSTKPSNYTASRIIKAAYLEPFLVVAHSNGAFIWSVMEEFCCAALPSKSSVTTITISRDFENWGLLAVGSKLGHVNCYTLN